MTTTQAPATRTGFRDLLDLSGKRAVVNGAVKGIGRGIAARLAEAGAVVILADADRDGAERAAGTIGAGGRQAHGYACDVTSEDQLVRLVQEVVLQAGGLDILVNNAGIYPIRPVTELSAAEWDRVQGVNLRGTFILSREFARSAVRRSAGGVIVNIGSIDSFHPSMAGLSAYDASKGGMLMLTRALALELGPRGIRVNMIAPGGINTEGSTAGLGGLSPAQAAALQQQFLARIPLGRMGVPDDIAKAALFLASDASSYMTGSVMVVDGGRLTA